MKIGLNLGCGNRIFKSTPELIWHNLDIQAGPHVDVVDDWRNLKAHWQDDIDIVIALQTYEHQGCGEQPIKQCYEVLKPRGSLIVSVPDLRKLALMWLRNELTTQIYMTNVYGPFDGTPESRHHWGFDPDSLREALVSAILPEKWYTIRTFDYRVIPGTEIPRDDRWILTLEAIK